ncbi:BREX system P-loop protein BrxC [Acinetobacter seifertii]|uniref:BREX system P-loop protein BrxC n=1 Tax=Acinetobacter seifertii TaxID=1530123 RepID=UPI001250CB94|nr:BREX system P-loop protein BrxC [Acinetobacter seifertii]QNY13570.1 BREX system P-loop protein BrxC [Acinetobacter seifertii]
MNIQQLFAKNLMRNINGVIKAEQVDASSVFSELDEYVVTNELEKHFSTFFENYADAVKQPIGTYTNKMGVWISGFFGSGKSHYLKILSYILANKVVEGDAKKRKPLDFFSDKVKSKTTLVDMQTAVTRPTDVILFNIDARANTDDREDAILKVFLKVFNELAGYCAELPHVAHFERHLVETGSYEKFKEKFQEVQGNSWDDERDAYNFYYDEIAQAFSYATGQTLESSLKTIEGIEQNFSVNIKGFCEWVKEYLDQKAKADKQDHNLLFLIDEIGQFIGKNTQMMLKLQTITEELGVICGGRAWVIVTSQADMNAAIGNMDAGDKQDFSKIQGRFYTKLALSSSNTLEVIQKRLLVKTEPAQAELKKIYQAQGDVLKSQLIFENATGDLVSYQNEQSFIDNYPFIPYQCVILQKVFESIRTKGASGKSLAMGERSLLDAYQTAAKQYRDSDLNILIPFYSFYASIESFLEPSVKRTIDQASESNPHLNEYDINILKTLFLTRYVELFQCTLENLVVLSIDEIDTDVIALKDKIQKSLAKLEKEMLIARQNDEFVFLTNEEKEIENEIQEAAYQTNESVKYVLDVIFDDVLKGKKQYRYPKNSQDFVITRFCQGLAKDGNLTSDLQINVITPIDPDYAKFTDDYASEQESRKSVQFPNGSIFIRLPDENPTLWDDIRKTIKTTRYLNQNNSSKANIATLLRDKAQENALRERRIIEQISKLLNKASIFAIGSLRPTQSSDFSNNLDLAFSYTIENSFQYINELVNDAQPLVQIKKLLTQGIQTDQLDFGDAHQGNDYALNKIFEYIELESKRSGNPKVSEVLEFFKKRPYGWNEQQVLLLIIQLIIHRRLEMTKSTGQVELSRIYDDLISVKKQQEFMLSPIRRHNEQSLKQLVDLAKEVFERHLANKSEHEVVADLREFIKSNWIKQLNEFIDQGTQLKRCPNSQRIKQLRHMAIELIGIGNDYNFIESLLKEKNDWRDAGEDFVEIRDFFKSQINAWKQLEEAVTVQFQANKNRLIEHNIEVTTWFKQLETIYQNDQPYNQISKISKLIEQLVNVQDELCQKILEKTKKLFNSRLERLDQAFADNEVPADIKNKAYYPLRELEKRMEAIRVVDSLIALQAEFEKAFAVGIDVLNSYIDDQRKEAERLKRKAEQEHLTEVARLKALAEAATVKGETQVIAPEPIQPKIMPQPVVAPRFKKTEYVKCSDILKQVKQDGTLATAKEIEDFLAVLQKELLSHIQEGDIVRLD